MESFHPLPGTPDLSPRSPRVVKAEHKPQIPQPQAPAVHQDSQFTHNGFQMHQPLIPQSHFTDAVNFDARNPLYVYLLQLTLIISDLMIQDNNMLNLQSFILNLSLMVNGTFGINLTITNKVFSINFIFLDSFSS